jgi:GNAT superfamily N-acetyltransferase
VGEAGPVKGGGGPPLSRPGAISPSHDTSSFFCGQDSLDDWLKNAALRSEGRSARTYVVCSGATVVGYYCLATGAAARASAPPKIRRNVSDPIPVMIVGRLAVDRHFERRGIGGGMLRDAFRRVLQASEAVGCRAVLVHAIDRNAVEFYAKFGFIEFPAATRTMFLPLETLKAAI